MIAWLIICYKSAVAPSIRYSALSGISEKPEKTIMKTIVILIVLIVATGVVYANNKYALRWRQNYEECAQMFGVEVDVRIDLILCALIKDGEVSIFQLLKNSDSDFEFNLTSIPSVKANYSS
ncbi:PREDICTED: uncharacterized protein LOC106749910, partial [Dinoponera quadriceps]|uniref:Uncharacterized protein LOC106749910 n=1 Tax=Dinoponera quadriceps TaxID=609295 RepID=A0A6P3Y5F7_DINQU